MTERQKILIVDDREENLFALEKILRETGVDVVKAVSGNEALAATLRNDFALAILDVQMPGMNGFELADHLRGDEKTRSMPIIFLTAAFTDEENLFKGYEAGAVDYIIKPFNPVVLNGKVAAFLELAKYRSKLEDMVQERTKRLRHLNRILRNVRNVNKLIVREQDQSRLIREACKLLVDGRGFNAAWITLVDDSRNLIDGAHEGFGEEFALPARFIQSGELPQCCKEVLHTGGVVVTPGGEIRCGDCGLSLGECSGGALVTILEHEGTVRGFMGIVVPAHMALDKEEQSLFQEAASDISYALHHIEITKERQTIAEELQQSEERLRLTLETTQIGIWDWDALHEQWYASPTCFTMLGYEPAAGKMNRCDWLKLAHPEDRARVNDKLRKMLTRNFNEHEYEARFRHADGSYRWQYVKGVSVKRDNGGKVARMLGIRIDINELKRAEEALRRSERKHRVLSENIPCAVFSDLPIEHSNNLFVSGRIEELTGYPVREFLQDSALLRRIICPEDRPHVWKQVEEHRKHKRVLDVEYRIFTKSGEVKWIRARANPTLDEEGEIESISGFMEDITERKRIKQTLEESEEKYRRIFENSIVGIFQTTPEGRWITANSAMSRLFGYASPEEMINEVTDIGSQMYVRPEDRDETTRRLNNLSALEGYEFECRRKDGANIWVSINAHAVRDERGEVLYYQGMMEDITDRKRLQHQLLQAQKMESIGTLAGGVAHDFNNILQVALGYSELVLTDERLPEHCRADLQKVHESSERGADLVKRLLTFSRKTEINPQPLNLNHRIKEMRKMIERTIPKMIEIRLSLAEDLARVNADPTQMDQIIMNLAVNARDAMPDGGKLTIETGNIVLDENYAKTNIEVTPGQFVILTVKDTGWGMDEETVKHIFEPFYTTKGVGEGTGLGLAMVHGIVKQHGGHLTCRSEPGKGTSLHIYFPAEVSSKEAEPAELMTMPLGGTETILLVDDEMHIRDLGSRILQKAGYNVITASNGREALEIYRTKGEHIRLVMLDLIMPEMGGKRCLEGLLSLDPSVKAIIASGYSANGPTKDALSVGAKGFVNKPFKIRQMLKVIREVLDAV